MNKKIQRIFIFWVILTGILEGVLEELKAQQISHYFTLHSSWEQNFDSLVGVHSSGLINGILYQTSYINADIHPFWQGRDWKNGSILYQGQFYPQVELMYDALDDQVILHHKDESNLNVWLQLFKSEIGFFTLQNKKFEFLNSREYPGLNAGFYELLHQGKHLRLVAKRFKEIHIENKSIQLKENNRFYLLFQNKVKALSSEKDIIGFFEDRKVEIKNFIRQNQLKIKPSRELDWIRLIEFCDQLIPRL